MTPKKRLNIQCKATLGQTGARLGSLSSRNDQIIYFSMPCSKYDMRVSEQNVFTNQVVFTGTQVAHRNQAQLL